MTSQELEELAAVINKVGSSFTALAEELCRSRRLQARIDALKAERNELIEERNELTRRAEKDHKEIMRLRAKLGIGETSGTPFTDADLARAIASAPEIKVGDRVRCALLGGVEGVVVEVGEMEAAGIPCLVRRVDGGAWGAASWTLEVINGR